MSAIIIPFKVGDVVELKGPDGPDMTVNAVVGDSVECVWFDIEDSIEDGEAVGTNGKWELFRATFSTGALRLKEEEA